LGLALYTEALLRVVAEIRVYKAARILREDDSKDRSSG
jgi:hypothetical protein